MTPEPSFVSHFFWIAVPIMLSMGVQQWLQHRSNQRRETNKDNKLAVLLNEYQLHRHSEQDGALKAENIFYPRSQVNGK